MVVAVPPPVGGYVVQQEGQRHLHPYIRWLREASQLAQRQSSHRAGEAIDADEIPSMKIVFFVYMLLTNATASTPRFCHHDQFRKNLSFHVVFNPVPCELQHVTRQGSSFQGSHVK